MKKKKSKNKGVLYTSIIASVIVIFVIAFTVYKNTEDKNASEKIVNENEEISSPSKIVSELDNLHDASNKKSAQSTVPKQKSEEASNSSNSNASSNQTNTNNAPSGTVNPSSGYIEGQPSPTEPTYIDGILIVNKKYPLPSTYNRGVDPEASAALTKMTEAAKAEGYELEAFSGFRSYEYQTSLYNRYVARDGQAAADRYSARPGYSEHQSGLAFDIGEKDNQDLWLTEEFGETPAGQWLMANAHKYGFILRYPKGKEDITGFMYESWHYRYLGVDVATKIYEANTTLEEYLNIQ